MSANDRVGLVAEISKTVQEILDEAKNQLDLVEEKTQNLIKQEQEINKQVVNIVRNCNLIATRLKEFHDRERQRVSDELDEQFKETGGN